MKGQDLEAIGLTRACSVHIHCIYSRVDNELLDLVSAVAWVQVFLAVPDLEYHLGEQCLVVENVIDPISG